LAVELKCDDEDALMRHLDAWWAKHLEPLHGAVAPSSISDRPQSPASPGMVYYRERPDEQFYWKAVREEVDVSSVPSPQHAWGGHGKIGAAAAVSWPGETATWEAIAWRSTKDTTQQRSIDTNALGEIDGWDGVVLSRDPRNGGGLVAPRGRSPVLFGVRGTSFAAAEAACRHLMKASGTESVAAWRVFKTNQASGDHLPNVLVLTVHEVETHPVRKHAHVHTDGPTLVAYAEGGPVNSLARWLQSGDVIAVAGLLHPDGTLHVERLKVKSWEARAHQRPLCSSCQVRLKSMGSGQGLRCPACKSRTPDAWVGVPIEPPFEDWVEPPMDARRHLARPLAWEDRVSTT
jgi:tRNA(Ile2)-agmatinylcytidine synthase